MKKSLKVSVSIVITTLAFGLSACGDKETPKTAPSSTPSSSSTPDVKDSVPPGTATEEATDNLTDDQLESMMREINIIENAEGDITQANFDVLLEKYETTEAIYKKSLAAFLETEKGKEFVKTLPAKQK